jgi:ribonuclease P protein component
MNAKFPKYQRLDSVKTITELFKNGHGFTIFPFKVIILKNNTNSPAPVQLLITVPKRHFKKAVHRNRIKRLIREVYRTHSEPLLSKAIECKQQYAVGIVFTGNQLPLFKEVETKLSTAINKLINNYIHPST